MNKKETVFTEEIEENLQLIMSLIVSGRPTTSDIEDMIRMLIKMGWADGGVDALSLSHEALQGLAKRGIH